MKRKNLCITLCVILAFAAIVVGLGISQYYRYAVKNFTARDGENHGYYVYPGATIDSVLTLIRADYDVHSMASFDLHSRQMMFHNPEPGYYEFGPYIADKTIINRLKHGTQTPVRLTFNHFIRTKEELSGKLAARLMLDSLDILTRMDSAQYMAQYGLTPETSLCLFIPNTYEVWWTIQPDELFYRMEREYKAFWTDARQDQAKAIGLNPVEVSILASIIESESHNAKELPIIASLYLNRIHKGMPLQSCPTVIFATGDLKLRRVLKRHLAIDSPYNTYKYVGLPPGPIRCPSPDGIDDVLNAPQTDYLYMCANPDFSGTHIFSARYGQHAAVAAKYQHQLNERDIK